MPSSPLQFVNAQTQPHPPIATLLTPRPQAQAPDRCRPWPTTPGRCAQGADVESVQCKTSHRDRARLRPECLGNQNRDDFKTKVTAIGAGFSITSPWPAHPGKAGRGQRVQRERIVESQRAQRPEVRSRPGQAGSGTPEISEQIAMRRSCSPGSWACAFGSIRFR